MKHDVVTAKDLERVDSLVPALGQSAINIGVHYLHDGEGGNRG